MRVNVKSWRGTREMELAQALQPSSSSGAHGALEGVRDDVSAVTQAIGCLLALLVERRTITVEEALECAGKYDEITPIEED